MISGEILELVLLYLLIGGQKSNFRGGDGQNWVKTPKSLGGDGQNCVKTPQKQNGPPSSIFIFFMYEEDWLFPFFLYHFSEFSEYELAVVSIKLTSNLNKVSGRNSDFFAFVIFFSFYCIECRFVDSLLRTVQ